MDIMELRDGSITVASAEGGVFDSIAGRYDRAANFDIYLKGPQVTQYRLTELGGNPTTYQAQG